MLEGAAVLQVSRISAYLAKLHGGASGKAIAVAKGNELLPKLFHGGNNLNVLMEGYHFTVVTGRSALKW